MQHSVSEINMHTHAQGVDTELRRLVTFFKSLDDYNFSIVLVDVKAGFNFYLFTCKIHLRNKAN